MSKFYKILLIIIVFLGIKLPSFSYETVIIDFPENEGWHMVYSKKTDKETIVQFMPRGETRESWTRTVVFHSYPQQYERNLSAIQLQQRMLNYAAKRNKTFRNRNIKVTRDDTFGYWCAKKNENMPGQCEILRTAQGYETVVAMHYINKNIDSLNQIEKNWLNIIKEVKHYYSYYRMDRMLNRETIFEF